MSTTSGGIALEPDRLDPAGQDLGGKPVERGLPRFAEDEVDEDLLLGGPATLGLEPLGRQLRPRGVRQERDQRVHPVAAMVRDLGRISPPAPMLDEAPA